MTVKACWIGRLTKHLSEPCVQRRCPMKSVRKNRSSIPEPSAVEWGLVKESVGHLVRRVHLKAQVAYAEALKPLDLTSFQFGILELASLNQFLTQRRLADLILVDPSIVVGAVDKLEDRGLIERRRSKDDRRAFILETTDAGLEMIEMARVRRAQAEDQLLEGLTPKRRRELIDALCSIAGI